LVDGGKWLCRFAVRDNAKRQATSNRFAFFRGRCTSIRLDVSRRRLDDGGEVWVLLAILMFGQTQASPLAAEPGVYVVTMGPGDASWEKFGHNMLWFHRPDRGIDVAWNWGIFDFNQKFFIPHFLEGKLWYWMGGDADAAGLIDFYLHDDRTIWMQELNLSPAQQQQLWDFCLWNSQEEHKYYKYDYYTNNCSTQVRDAIDHIIGGQISRLATTMPMDVTYRSETLRLIADALPLYVGIDFILGQPVDRPLTAWQEMFIPMRMRERLNQIQIIDDAGNQVPLVKKEILLNTSKRPPLRNYPPNWIGWFLLAGAIIGAALAWLGRLGSRWRKWGFAIVAVSWSLLAGFAGWFLVYAWTLTDHVDARNNENILQLSPLMLPLVVLIPLALAGWRKSSRAALVLAGISLVGCVLGLMMKILPTMHQVNGNIIALAIPANLGLVWALWKLSVKGKTQ
jgi:hypothetical protein